MSVATTALSFLSKNLPAILTGVGAVGVVATSVAAAKVTPQAVRVLMDDSIENGPYTSRMDEVKRTVKLTWRLYLPAVLLGSVSIAAIFGVNHIHANRAKALAVAFSALEATAHKYQQKVIEVLGENNDQKVRDGLAEDAMKTHPVSASKVFITNKGEHLMFESLTGRYFHSDIETVRQAVNNINEQLLNSIGGWVSVNEFFTEIGLPPTELGELGWSTDKLLDVSYSTMIAENKEPCIVLDYRSGPVGGLRR